MIVLKKDEDRGQLQLLFQLRYLDGVTDKEVLAQALGIQSRTLKSYYRRIFVKIDAPKGPNRGTNEARIELHKDFVCPECLLMSVQMVGVMRVCTKCGLELGRWDLDTSIPFDSTFAPTSSMALGKSLGGTLPSKQIFRVLALSPTGRKDIGLRARYMNIIHESNETPTVKKLIEYGSGLLKNIGFEEKHVFANIYADHLRKLAAYLEAKRMNRTHRYAHALLAHLLIDLVPEMTIQNRLKYDDHETRFILLWLELDELANVGKAEGTAPAPLYQEALGLAPDDVRGSFHPESEPNEGYFLRLSESIEVEDDMRVRPD